MGPSAVLAVAARLVREASLNAGAEPVAIGVGTAGVVDAATGLILGATEALRARGHLYPLLGRLMAYSVAKYCG